MKVCQSCLTLCDLTDYTVHGILQARILEWVAFPFSRGSSQPRDRTRVSCFAGGFFTSWAIREALKAKVAEANYSPVLWLASLKRASDTGEFSSFLLHTYTPYHTRRDPGHCCVWDNACAFVAFVKQTPSMAAPRQQNTHSFNTFLKWQVYWLQSLDGEPCLVCI